MNELLNYSGKFDVLDFPLMSNTRLRKLLSIYGSFENIPCLNNKVSFNNLIMANAKLLMAQTVFPKIDRLVITNQTTPPVDNETSYTGVVYTTASGDEFDRSGPSNPYTVTWSIASEAANGVWSSIVLIDAAGNMINRALSGANKTSGTLKIVQFTGKVE